jgi:hypothetical protein
MTAPRILQRFPVTKGNPQPGLSFVVVEGSASLTVAEPPVTG